MSQKIENGRVVIYPICDNETEDERNERIS